MFNTLTKFKVGICSILISIFMITNTKMVLAYSVFDDWDNRDKKLVLESNTQLQALVSSPINATPPTQFSIDELLQKTELSKITLSYTGTKIAYLRNDPKQALLNKLYIYDYEQKTEIYVGSFKEIINLVWNNQDKALFVIDRSSIIYVNLTGTPISFKRIYQFSKANKEVIIAYSRELERFLIGSESESYNVFAVGQDRVKKKLYSSSEKVSKLIFIDGPKHYIEQVDFSDKRVISLVKNEKEIPLLECRYMKMCSLTHFAKSKNEVFYRGYLKSDKRSLLAINIETKVKRVITTDADNRVDIFRQWTHQDDSVTASYIFDKPKYTSNYKPMQLLLAKLKEQLGDSHFSIQISDNGRRAFVSIGSANTHHPLHFSYDFLSEVLTPFDKLVHYEKSPLKKDELATSLAIHFEASDGMLIHGYLWAPTHGSLSKVPLVTVVHGGPWSRDFGLFCFQCQLLVNQGYAVFQPNYRSSWGFGLDYVLAAKQDFGKGRVLQDTIDGIEYLLQSGIGHRDKLAIAGHSFGGFTTLSALAFEPGYFKAGFASAPAVELSGEVTALFSRNKPRFGIDRANEFNILLVDQNDSTQLTKLKEKSPQKHYRNIIDPLLILAGGLDKKVGISRVNQFAVALKADNKSISYFVDKKMGHSPKTYMHKKAMLYLLHSFMATHLGGNSIEMPDDSLNTYLNRNQVYLDEKHLTRH
jgi:dipeptidyl aminopeptidase/acylaminoacyl peptidase